MKYCPKCGSITEDENLYCPKCGYGFDSLEIQDNLEGSIIEDRVYPVTKESITIKDNNEIRSLRAALIGKKADYYIPVFEKLDRKGVSWNWFAFFVGPYWFGYRKMYGWAAIAFILPQLLGYVFAISAYLLSSISNESVKAIISIVGLSCNIVIGIVANNVYKKRIDKLVMEAPKNSDDRNIFIKAKGGVSIPGLIITTIICFTISAISIILAQ